MNWLFAPRTLQKITIAAPQPTMKSLAQIYLMEHELISADGFQVPGQRTGPGSVTWTNGLKRSGSAEGPGVSSHK